MFENSITVHKKIARYFSIKCVLFKNRNPFSDKKLCDILIHFFHIIYYILGYIGIMKLNYLYVSFIYVIKKVKII